MGEPARKTCLLAGLGKYSTGFGISGDAVTKMVEDSFARAAEHGFDCTLVHLDPSEAAGARKAMVEALKEKQWDGVAVGFGLRGVREHTPLFEDVMNAVREFAPQARLMFTTYPDDMFNALHRVFPECFE